MKKYIFWSFLFACIGLHSCQNTTSEKKLMNDAAKQEKPIAVTCYKSIYDKDSITLQLNSLKNGKISGDMVMSFNNAAVKKGTVSGNTNGDTIFVSYTFIEGDNTKVTFKNPMAFLKRGDSLVLGNGKMQTTMGATYFVKGEPIDFDRVKFKFSVVDCK